ncbi:SGNH/GDSL hydrolase family protein [Sandaracinus amylolyticus]|uniref:SGNH/GDSL hydrolase family protein n=1 Tax=Sandaracinus amylolyticus TaxID=927083 RepID=UPI0012EE2046|nr:SGNH/GDSL hydrolase family protein [Sandaracinus amylolyticus]
MAIEAAFIGDSQAGGLAAVLRRELARRGVDVIASEHRNGASTRVLVQSGVLARALRARPAVLIVAAGGNDTTAAASTWSDVVDRALRAGVRRVVWIGPPASFPHGTQRDAERAAVSELQAATFARTLGVAWISGRATANGIPRRDEVHFDSAGYAGWAARLAPHIAAALRLRSAHWSAVGVVVAICCWMALTAPGRFAVTR